MDCRFRFNAAAAAWLLRGLTEASLEGALSWIIGDKHGDDPEELATVRVPPER